MGGNAIKIAKRQDKTSFTIKTNEIVEILNKNNIINYPIKSYSQKESFGDSDIMIQQLSDFEGKNYMDYVSALFPFKEKNINSNVCSIDYKEMQTDFIFVSNSNWKFAKVFFDYNDLGNLIGKTSLAKRCKFGQQGLFTKISYKNRIFEQTLSKNPTKTLEYLGFDIDRYNQGFDTLEDIFQFIIDSKYFNKELYENKQLTSHQKARDNNRKNWNLFKDYIKNLPDSEPFIKPDKVEMLKEFDNVFSTNLVDSYNIFTKEVDRSEQIAFKFNGNILLSLGYSGKEIGDIISKFKSSFNSKEERYSFIENNTIETIINKALS